MQNKKTELNESKKTAPKKADFIDDGRVIADMSIGGMPRSLPETLIGGKRPKLAKLDHLGRPIDDGSEPVKLTKEEKKAIRRGVMKAYLLVGIGSAVLFTILFVLLYFFWLR